MRRWSRIFSSKAHYFPVFFLLLAIIGVWTVAQRGVREAEARGALSSAEAGGLQAGDNAREYQTFLPTFSAPYDMVDFLHGDGERLFEVKQVRWDGEHQARHQTQTDGELFFHTKGNELSAEWEELWADEAYIYRGTDTSPGNGEYYTLRDPGIYGSKWAPRYWAVGEVFERAPQVTFYRKDNCAPIHGGVHRTYLRFDAFHRTYTFKSGITLDYVVELAWVLTPEGEPLETYFYADAYGLVGWTSSSGANSFISEDHAPGARPDNVREVISCLDRSPSYPLAFRGPLLQWRDLLLKR